MNGFFNVVQRCALTFNKLDLTRVFFSILVLEAISINLSVQFRIFYASLIDAHANVYSHLRHCSRS